jgi:flagellar protein FlaF
MPVGELIGAAIGVLLLIIVAYVLIGSTLGGAEVVASAQRDMVHLQEIRIDTTITVTPDPISTGSTPSETLTFHIENTGTEPITDLKDMDVFIGDASGDLQRFYFGGVASTDNQAWTAPGNSIPPGNTITGTLLLPGAWTPPLTWTGTPSWIKVVTSNGRGVYNPVSTSTG